MLPLHASCLPALRRLRRTLSWVLLPALLASAVTGGACAAMLASPPVATAIAAVESEHAHHHHSGKPAAPAALELPAPCPHCPLESGAANVANADCAAADGAAGAALKPSPPVDAPNVPAPFATLVTAGAIPPLIPPAWSSYRPPLPRVALTVRHCVWLI